MADILHNRAAEQGLLKRSEPPGSQESLAPKRRKISESSKVTRNESQEVVAIDETTDESEN